MTNDSSPRQPDTAPWDPGLYDARHAFVWKAGADLLDLLSPEPGERILDLGCGTGHLTAAIAARGADVVGLDASKEMIDAAREAYPQIPFLLADAADFTVDAPYDAVFSNAALHWMTRPGQVAANIVRALRLGGRFVAEFGGKGNVEGILAALHAAIRAETPGIEPVNPWYFPSIGEYAALLEGNGLEVTFAVLFDRPTPLEGEEGFRAWVRMFGAPLLRDVPEEQRAAVVDRAETMARSTLCRDGTWYADYRRLRLVAKR
jgi:trans-aconitate methyltransferase